MLHFWGMASRENLSIGIVLQEARLSIGSLTCWFIFKGSTEHPQETPVLLSIHVLGLHSEVAILPKKGAVVPTRYILGAATYEFKNNAVEVNVYGGVHYLCVSYPT